MSTQHDASNHGWPNDQGLGSRSSRRLRAVRRKKSRPFQPDFHDLERRMLPTTFMVMNPADSGVGSLRQAIVGSNAAPGSNVIDFSIGTGTQTISLLSALPTITVPVTIDGTSQPGYAGAPLIDVDGGSAGPGVSGLVFDIGSDGSVAKGLDVSDFSHGIDLLSNDDLVQGCYIGINLAGTAPMANSAGIEIESAGNSIGGTAPGAGNVISGNAFGVVISRTTATANLLEGNLIGTNAAGTAAVPNSYGVAIEPAPGNTIGGTAAGAGNLISGNAFGGILIFGLTATGNLIEGNRIGTNAAGTASLSDDVGIAINAFNNTIGGTAAGAANLISGNSDYGIILQNQGGNDPQGIGNYVEGNLIGTNSDGSNSIPNGGGVYVEFGAGNKIGGASPSAGNVISGNTYRNVYLYGSAGNVVEGNRIGTNAAGTAALGSNSGVFIEGSSSGNTIGGTAAGAGNLISGNTTPAVNSSFPSPAGVEIVGDGTSNNVVEGNLIGTNLAGTGPLPNGSGTTGGVVISGGATNNTIGGTALGARNVISGNVGAGVSIDVDQGDGTTGNLVEGNLIGTTAAGTGALPNAIGVQIESPGNTIGGPSPGSGNLISGNSSDGIFILGTTATANEIAGNKIGTDISGSVALTNSIGIFIVNAPNNTIGGLGLGAGNLISGNTVTGIYIALATATGNLIEGNHIGTDVTGTTALANSTGVEVHSSGNTIGGTAVGAGNLISGNTFDGLDLGTDAPGNLVEGNLIGTNAAGTTALANITGILIESTGNTIGGLTVRRGQPDFGEHRIRHRDQRGRFWQPGGRERHRDEPGRYIRGRQLLLRRRTDPIR